MFENLESIQATLSPKNQKLIPILKKVFTDFKEHLLEDIQTKFDSMVTVLKEECLAVCNAKDEKIHSLEGKCKVLEDKITQLEERFDDEDAYIRRETLILSGEEVTRYHESENCADIVRKVIKDNLHIELKPEDISVSHRLGRKSVAQGPDKRSITAKFCRRDLKREILLAARSQKPRECYINESLTPLRQKISAALRRAKKRPNSTVSGHLTIDGRIFAWAKSSTPGERNTRHCINTIPALEDFCLKNLGCPASELLTQPPTARHTENA